MQFPIPNTRKRLSQTARVRQRRSHLPETQWQVRTRHGKEARQTGSLFAKTVCNGRAQINQPGRYGGAGGRRVQARWGHTGAIIGLTAQGVRRRCQRSHSELTKAMFMFVQARRDITCRCLGESTSSRLAVYELIPRNFQQTYRESGKTVKYSTPILPHDYRRDNRFFVGSM